MATSRKDQSLQQDEEEMTSLLETARDQVPFFNGTNKRMALKLKLATNFKASELTFVGNVAICFFLPLHIKCEGVL